MKNQDLKSGLFGSIGENMVAFELAKRNWYVYRPYFDTRIDFIVQKFVCKTCFSEWESKHIITCSNEDCSNHMKDLNGSSYVKTRRCVSCSYSFDKYATSADCPKCKNPMRVELNKKSGQRNYSFFCDKCGHSFTSQQRGCVSCGGETVESPVCIKCSSDIVPIFSKCSNPECNGEDYAVIFRTIQVKSSHEEESGTIGFNFKLQDMIEDDRHFLVVYSRTFEEDREKHNYWVMTVDEFKNEYVKDTASAVIYQNNRQHPPSRSSSTYFDEKKYNGTALLLQKARKSNDADSIIKLENELRSIDVFGKLNMKSERDF